MELPELTLAPTSCRLTRLECSSSSESSDNSSSRKRKAFSDSLLDCKSLQAQRSVDLQHSNERLPLDWEQCLDLESGKMYYMNRKTLKKSWDRPTTKDHQHQHHSQKLDLELNISSSALSSTSKPKQLPFTGSEKKCFELMGPLPAALPIITKKDDHHLYPSNQFDMGNNNHSNSNNMVAMACMNCHLLVIVSKSAPTCPNCKYVHSIPPPQQVSSAAAPRKPTFKPLDTLSLFS